METFSEWLQIGLKKRDWNQSDLVRKSNLSSGQVSRLISGSRGPGVETCQAIAQAFGIPEELVMQKAGLLSTPEEQSELIRKTLFDMGFLPIEDQEEIMEFVRLKRAIHERRSKYEPK